MVKLLDGKIPAQNILQDVKDKVHKLKERNIYPGLVTILVGDNPSSHIYVLHKQRACTKVGIYNQIYYIPTQADTGQIVQLISQLNKDSQFHGILVQLPLPTHLNEDKILATISPNKDVDGLTPTIVGTLLSANIPPITPATPLAILTLLDYYKYNLKGQTIVIVGASRIVGRPLALMMIQREATVILCHKETRDLSSFTCQADILISAAGCPKLIKREMIKERSVIIDVGITRIMDLTKTSRYRVEGDIDFKDVADKAGAITPVPGGVGPLTIATLLSNLVRLVRD